MTKTLTVTATEASRSVYKLLRAVKQGHRVEITKRGHLVAVLKPIEDF